MARQIDFRPIYNETQTTIRERLDANADPTIDKRPGEVYYDITQSVVPEFERVYEAINTMAAITFLPWAFGPYLDYKGKYEIGIEREDATYATGEVTIAGERGATIPNGTIVATTAYRPDDPVYRFQTTVADEIGMDPPPDQIIIALGTAGAITGDVSYRYTFVGRGGETEMNNITIGLSPTADRVEISDIATGPSGTTARNLYRQDGNLNPYKFLATIPNNTQTTYTDNTAFGLATADGPSVNTTDETTIPIQALEKGMAYNVSVAAINQLSQSIDGVEVVINLTAVMGGQDKETDVHYIARMLDSLAAPRGQANASDYKEWALRVEGVEIATVFPLANGNNTVKIVVVGPEHQPTVAGVVEAVQALIDPNENGDGSGLGPPGAVVSVVTITIKLISLEAVIIHETGFSLDGAGGTTATEQAIIDAVDDYFRSLEPGSTVIWAEVVAAIISVQGVLDVTLVELNNSTANVNTTSTEVPGLNTISLS